MNKERYKPHLFGWAPDGSNRTASGLLDIGPAGYRNKAPASPYVVERIKHYERFVVFRPSGPDKRIVAESDSREVAVIVCALLNEELAKIAEKLSGKTSGKRLDNLAGARGKKKSLRAAKC